MSHRAQQRSADDGGGAGPSWASVDHEAHDRADLFLISDGPVIGLARTETLREHQDGLSREDEYYRCYSYFVRITSKGQVTIPQQVRRELGLEPGDEVSIDVHDGVAQIVPIHGPTGRGRRVVAALLGRGDVPLSTDEIMALTRGD